MIVVFHSNRKITQVINTVHQAIPFETKTTIAEGLYQLALQFPDEKIIWCHDACKEQLDLEAINSLFHHNKMILSYRPDQNNFFGSKVGYVEESLFVNINKSGTYPTWQMSGSVGVIHANVLNEVKDKVKPDADLDYFLSSLAKMCMPLGLLCYSEPKLLKSHLEAILPQAGIIKLFRFVKQHYRTRWVFLLLLNLFLYERKFPLVAFAMSFFYNRRNNTNINLDFIAVQSIRKAIDKGTLDVIIPTVGRKQYLYQVLKDFTKQTVLPHKIIIVEQNPDLSAKSELDYIEKVDWPFEIQHFFIHQAGACNARNLALAQVESEWVFLADDDIKIDENFIKNTFQFIQQWGAKSVSLSCLQKGETEKYHTVFQWPGFGSGCSFVASEFFKSCKFNMGYEFGYGEDADYGMQLRNLGQDVLYLPNPKILHLKAPIGGFRTKPLLQWHNDPVQPKPSPTVMLYNLLHHTQEQISGYKTTLFLKFYRHQKIKNPIQYYNLFQKQWNQSVFWANKLKQQS